MLEVSFCKQLPDLTIELHFSVNNNILVLFGSSGCGKTTSLRCIAGLERPDGGYIKLNGQIFYDRHTFIPPRDRGIGYMFQDYALFPHMDVRKNILYGVPKNSRDAENLFHELIALLKIRHLIHRSVTQLSGGEKQRVALARALMARPKLLLLDEPLSALDIDTRLELQDELRNMQALWKIPFILVTHDREEAKKLGDTILFIHQGRQTAPPANWA
jgi:molybdate transport system ATP-binding protein